MRRAGLLGLLLALAGCAAPPEKPAPPAPPAAAHEPGRVAVLKAGERRAYEAPVTPFKTALGRAVNVFELKGEGREGGKAVMDALLATRPPLIFAIGGEALTLAREHAKGTPVVFAIVINWAKHGVEGAPNVAGIALEVPPETQFTQLKIVAPAVRRVGVIHSDGTRELVEQARAAAKKLGIEIESAPVAAPGEVPAAWGRLQGRIDALWMVPDARAIDPERFTFLKDATLAARTPFMGFSDSFVKAGCLLSLSADYESIGSQAGIVASRILAGEASPKQLGVAPPVGTHLTLNLETARAIGLAIDESVVDLADDVVGGEPDGG